ncbi:MULTISPECIES: ATP-binding protein [unclassified Microcoleus]|uniref:ATP-binding protein n=1 Tax=unclassified Microcoleus TaxID=2642155 RepID=UPI002FD5F049
MQDLEERYPQFFSKKLNREIPSVEISQTTSSPTSTGVSHLDITTIMKASQALAGEIVLDKLLSKLMLIVRENAGAQKGSLILEKDGELFVEATITEEGDEVNVLQSIPVYVGTDLTDNLETTPITPLQNPHSSNLPLSLINYVTRTRENLVLNDANAEPRFSADPYIVTFQPKSLLCTPLIHQGKLVGLLYLENNLTKGAFTSDRLEILRLLSSQAAISIENARLYTNLETAKNQLQDYSKTLEVKVEERTLELKEKNDYLQQEIRDRLLAEDALRLSEERFRAIFESTDDFIAVWDKNYHCLYANQAWLDNIQKPRDRVIGKSFPEILKDSPELIPLWTSRFETVFNTCKSLHFEDATNVGDLPSYSESTLSPIKDSTGNVFAVGVVYRDITERKLAEAALRDSEARLRQQAIELQQALDELRRTQIQLIQNEKMASLGQLVGGVAHEINNPASFIYGNLSHAQEYIQNLFNILNLYQKHYPEPDPEIQEQAEKNEIDFIVEDLPKLLESMQMGVKRISNIVLSLRNFSRLDESDMKRVDIHEGIESTLLILQNRFNKNDGTPAIEVIKEYGTMPAIECYVGHLNQVFMNILTNAIDALEEGKGKLGSPQSPIPSIRIRTELIDNKIAVRIADNGSGIPEEIQQNIFDPFFTTKPVGKGTGLGLSISYKIVVEKHGGNLRCISSPGKGAELIVEIPLRQLIKT